MWSPWGRITAVRVDREGNVARDLPVAVTGEGPEWRIRTLVFRRADTCQAAALCFINRVNRMIDSAQLVNAHMNILFERHLWRYRCGAQEKW